MASAPAPKPLGLAPTPTSANSVTSSSPTQRPPRRSARNSTTSAPCRPMPTPAAGTTRPPDMSASRPVSINTSNDYAATTRPTRLLDPGREGRLMRRLCSVHLWMRALAPNTSRTAADRALAPSSTHHQQPVVEGQAAVDQVGQQRAHHGLVLRGAVPQPDRLLGAVGGDGQRDHDRSEEH